MKRRNAEGGKLRRPIKRTKITEGIYGSTLLYLKFLMLWALVLLADFILEFRFEFLWPFWLLLRSVYDSFKYQGLAFSAFFVCVAATSDMICFFFIPVHWLFFLASTYVWVQYVWHTEKGICLPTVILCMLFVYVEAAVRLRGDFRHPFHVDLCRPFAAHCIGYPVVTFGFGFKSYVGYRMRQRRQKEVAKENEFYMQLLQQALPAQQEVQTPVINSTSPEKNKGTPSPITEQDNLKMSNGSVANGVTVSPNSSVKNNHRKSLDKGPEKDQQDKKISHNHTNGSIHTDVEYIERISSVNDFDVNEIEKDKVTKGCNNRSQEKGGNKWNSNKQAQENVVNSQREKRSKNNKESHTETNNFTNRDEYLQRLEADVKRLKIDLQSSRQIEQDLRSQLVSVTNCERSAKSELTQLQHHNDDLQTRLHGLVSARQLDKQAMSQLEKKLADERRARGSCEAQLAAERKAKKAEEAAAAQAVAIATALNKGECTESCRARRRELEAETKQLKRELKLKEERILSSEREIQSLRQYRDNHSETEILMSALSAMQDKTTHLENSLSAETKIKLDLFSALGEAKRQLEIRENLIRTQEKELEELKGKLAQVLAVMPTEPFCSSPPPTSGTSKFRLSESHLRCFTNDDSFGAMASLRSLTESPVSTLDPNATAYTPKGTLVTSTEA
ncbi:UNVERIFIED_CONTAM: hypothetical protein PYX00_003417 [Menopon gallinae]|uniref:Macoilin n=1 Tax=Menopon gallinae TaxID=328185 RepID=A0AAW2I0C8_9NEOP